MNRYLTAATVAAAMLASGAMAQDHQQGSHNPAIKDSSPQRVTTSAQGSNSFTESQARGRIAKAGYSRVSALQKDDGGVWRGMAYRGRTKVKVGLDYKGNITH